MLLAKTDKARAALQMRSADLGARERQALILCNGQRRTQEIAAMLGADSAAVFDKLYRQGYVMPAGWSIATPPAPAIELPATKRPPAAQATPREATKPHAEKTASSAPRTRSSVAATKMYVVDLLQLMRDMEASSLAVAVYSSTDEMELMDSVMAALRFIHQRTKPSYAQRVVDRLAEIIPERHRASLDAVVAELALEPVSA